MATSDMPAIGQGPAKLVTRQEFQLDQQGFTNPNLHRRTYTAPEGTPDQKIRFSIHGVDSYRTTEFINHDEESTTSEIP